MSQQKEPEKKEEGIKPQEDGFVPEDKREDCFKDIDSLLSNWLRSHK